MSEIPIRVRNAIQEVDDLFALNLSDMEEAELSARIIAAIELDPGEWFLIEEAPIDGEEILGWNMIERRVMWFHHDGLGNHGFIIGWDEVGPDWFYPTHWQPLQRPPNPNPLT
jgi:hypothetical protein